MSNQPPQTDTTPLPPPSGDGEKADRYLTQIIELINEDKLIVSHTDLAKFDPTSLQDHYRLDLKDYEVEISHNKQANTGKDSYIILFNNLKSVNEKCTEKVILAYLYLTGDQFAKFKTIADDQIERKRKEAEEKRFKEAMAPIDQVLGELTTSPKEVADEKIDTPLETNTQDDNQHIHMGPIDTPSSSTPPAFVASS